MDRDSRRPLIGLQYGKKSPEYSQKISNIASHLSRYHCEDSGLSRLGGWIALYYEPETGTHWESHRFEGNRQGGGGYSMIPLQPFDVEQLYKCPQPVNPDEAMEIAYLEINWHGEAQVHPNYRIWKHLTEEHLLDLTGLDEGSKCKRFVSPEDGRSWVFCDADDEQRQEGIYGIVKPIDCCFDVYLMQRSARHYSLLGASNELSADTDNWQNRGVTWKIPGKRCRKNCPTSS